MIFNKYLWGKIMGNMFLRDCTIGFEPGRLGFLLYEYKDATDHLENGWLTRTLYVNMTMPMDERFFSRSGTGFGFGSISSAWSPNNTEYVSADIGKQVISYKPKAYKGNEPEIPFNPGPQVPGAYGEFGAAISKVIRVGTTVFAVGGPYRVFERIGHQQWKEHKELPIPASLRSADRETYIGTRAFFNDMAGLSINLMYVVGEEGAIWMYTNGRWLPLTIPTNHDLHTVACAPDGMVYITDHRGCVWRGKENTWERIVKKDQMLPYQDSAWFDGRLWCTNDSAGCDVLEDNRMVAAHRARHKPMPAQVACFAHRLDVSPDGKTMMAAGRQGAAVYDGQTWEVLFDGEPKE